MLVSGNGARQAFCHRRSGQMAGWLSGLWHGALWLPTMDSGCHQAGTCPGLPFFSYLGSVRRGGPFLPDVNCAPWPAGVARSCRTWGQAPAVPLLSLPDLLSAPDVFVCGRPVPKRQLCGRESLCAPRKMGLSASLLCSCRNLCRPGNGFDQRLSTSCHTWCPLAQAETPSQNSRGLGGS